LRESQTVTERDLRAEEVTRECTGWETANGYDPDIYAEYGIADVSEAFAAGMQAERNLWGLEEPALVAGVAYSDYPSLVAAMQAEIDRERTMRLHLAGGQGEARSDFSRLRRVLLDDGLSDTVARKRCLAVIATAGTPPVDVPLDVQRRHRPGECQCAPCKEAASG
jgi:hypothetical protein